VAKTSTAGSTVYELYVDTAVAPVVGPGPQPKSGSGSAAVNIRLNGVTHNVSGGSVTAGAWHHMAATWDGSTIRLYLDGVEVGATSATGVLAVDHTLPVTVGNVNAGDRGFEGAIDNVQILSTAAPAAAIATHHGNLAASGAFHSFGQEQTGAPGPWTVAAVGRTGGHSLEAPATAGSGAAAWAVATGLDEPGMVLEGWWLYSSDAGLDIAAGTRAGTDPTDGFETWLDSPSGWGLRHRSGSTEVQDAAPSGTPAAGSWTKVELHTDQNGDSRVVVDGTELIGSTAQGPVPATGSVGFRVGALPGTESWQIDDVRGRRLVAPEPVTTLGPLDRS
jgi:hypothetical protein